MEIWIDECIDSISLYQRILSQKSPMASAILIVSSSPGRFRVNSIRCDSQFHASSHLTVQALANQEMKIDESAEIIRKRAFGNDPMVMMPAVLFERGQRWISTALTYATYQESPC